LATVVILRFSVNNGLFQVEGEPCPRLKSPSH